MKYKNLPLAEPWCRLTGLTKNINYGITLLKVNLNEI